MKTWAVFTIDGIEQCGSDAWFQIDARFNTYNINRKAYEKLNQLKSIHPYWNGYVLKYGSSIRTAKIFQY